MGYMFDKHISHILPNEEKDIKKLQFFLYNTLFYISSEGIYFKNTRRSVYSLQNKNFTAYHKDRKNNI